MPEFEVFELMSHLQKCPEVFLQPSYYTSKEGLNSTALICDVCRMISNNYLKNDFQVLDNVKFSLVNDNQWRSIHISIWLLNHQNFKNKPFIEEKLQDFWFKDLHIASQFVKYREWISDEERSEEMVRLLLKTSKILPFGETEEEADDKLSSISSAERHNVLQNSYNAHERIMKIKREMAEKKAREAANTYGRE